MNHADCENSTPNHRIESRESLTSQDSQDEELIVQQDQAHECQSDQNCQGRVVQGDAMSAGGGQDAFPFSTADYNGGNSDIEKFYL